MFDPTPTSNPLAFIWEPSEFLLTPASTLQGGAGLGVAMRAVEMVTGRSSVWAAAQYLTYAIGTSPVDIRVTVEVAGFNTTQARCVLLRDEKEILTAHVALGSRSLPYERTWATIPDVPRPEDCPPFGFFDRSARNLGGLVEIRSAKGRQIAEIRAEGTSSDGLSAFWFRCWHGPKVPSVADLALIGDFMPLGFPHAMGLPYVGNSLDNTIRIGNGEATEWILLNIQVQQVTRGFGYGRAELWSEGGSLLGEVSQSAALRPHTDFRDPRNRSTADPNR